MNYKPHWILVDHPRSPWTKPDHAWPYWIIVHAQGHPDVPKTWNQSHSHVCARPWPRTILLIWSSGKYRCNPSQHDTYFFKTHKKRTNELITPEISKKNSRFRIYMFLGLFFLSSMEDLYIRACTVVFSKTSSSSHVKIDHCSAD